MFGTYAQNVAKMDSLVFSDSRLACVCLSADRKALALTKD